MIEKILGRKHVCHGVIKRSLVIAGTLEYIYNIEYIR